MYSECPHLCGSCVCLNCKIPFQKLKVVKSDCSRCNKGLRHGDVRNDELFKMSNIILLKEFTRIRSDTLFNLSVKRNALTQYIGILTVHKTLYRVMQKLWPMWVIHNNTVCYMFQATCIPTVLSSETKRPLQKSLLGKIIIEAKKLEIPQFTLIYQRRKS